MITSGNVAPDRPVLLWAHGAGAGERHPWMRQVAAGLAARGVTVVTFDFPYIQNGRRLPDRGPVLEATFARIWSELLTGPAADCRCFVGGKSMGGRIATQVAARGGFLPPPAGIVCFGYPLHPPAKPTVRRDAHLPAVHSPLLLVQGTRDPFGTPDEMQALSAALPTSRLHLIEGGDHSLAVKGRDGLAEALDIAAAWLVGRM